MRNTELGAEILESFYAVLSIQALNFTTSILEYEDGCPIERWPGEQFRVRGNGESVVAQHVLKRIVFE